MNAPDSISSSNAVDDAAALTARGIRYDVGGKRLLDNVSLSVTPGKLVVVVGPNGAGKTTLLRLLAGELDPTQGNIWLAGRLLRQWPRRERARMLGVLPQHSSPSFPMTAFEVVLLGRAPHVRYRESADDLAIATAALECTDAAHLAARRYATLSGGEKSRVQTARVLAQIWGAGAGQPRFLLLDEPTAALDLTHQHRLLQLARRLTRSGVGVLAILHDLNLAAQYADEIVVMAGGKTARTGCPEAVFTVSLLAEVFRLESLVIKHPKHGWPLIVPTGQSGEVPAPPQMREGMVWQA